MNEFDEKRRYANGELVMLLYKLVQENPSMRFGQILSNFGFVEDAGWERQGVHVWADEFYLEPTELLERVKATMKQISNGKR